jgi:osmoprotectant transport system substrate-binding protein/osmoprotectant transport system permease protein
VRLALAAALAVTLLAGSARAEPVVIASKAFTESVILAEMACQLVREAGLECEHRRQLGGTRVVWEAMVRGDVHVYPEYTGTIAQEIFSATGRPSLDELRTMVAERGIGLRPPLGFDNSYALGITKKRAAALGLQKLSDLASRPELRLRFSNEFMDRADGWPALRQAYGLPQTDVRGLDHDLAYRGLVAGDFDVMDVYTTDGEIAYYDLVALDDDRRHFPRYDALFVHRLDVADRFPGVLEALARLEGRIDSHTMSALNARAKIDHVPEDTAAAEFLQSTLHANVAAQTSTLGGRLFERTREHLTLVALSLLAAILVAVPLGILAARRRLLGQAVLGIVGVAQTVPSLVLLVLLIPVLGIGTAPAVAALFVYSLLPIVRNTHAGLTGIAPPLIESAAALGLPRRARLFKVELPLASRSILAGIKTSAVINVGTATLGAIIGAGGYGQPILTGIRLDDVGLIMEGALPAAALALVVQGLFDLAERWLVPRGLRAS